MQNRLIISTTIALLLISINAAEAQTQKGSQLVGVQVGNLVFSGRDNVGTAVQLKPTYGLFISNNLAVGLAIPVYYFSGGIPKNSIKVMQIGLSPFIRYYIGSATIKPFLSASGGMHRTTVKELTATSAPAFNWLYSFGGGVAFFLAKNASFDIAVNYTGTGNRDYYSLDGYAQNGLTYGIVDAVNLNVGFQLYFGGK